MNPSTEAQIPLVRGTRDWMPPECRALRELEGALLQGFAQAGYEQIRTPILEQTELHERRSGAGIVSKLYGVDVSAGDRVCLRPELTAGVVRAFAEMEPAPPLPWRVSVLGTVFRNEPHGDGKYREFHQVGVEMLGASGPAMDGEVLWLADWSLARLGARETKLRLGYVGVIQEILRRSGLPDSIQAAVVEKISDQSAQGYNIGALDAALERLRDWIDRGDSGEITHAADGSDPVGEDRLFRTLFPVMTGRRSGHEVLERLRRKWDLGHRLKGSIARLRDEIHAVAELKGPATRVLETLARTTAEGAPESLADLRALVKAMADYGIDLDRVELDLGFGRGLGFYSRMVFELYASTSAGWVEVCGGGRYDGFARVLGSNRDDRGVGFAFGLERLRHALGEAPAERNGEAAGFLVVPQAPDREAEAIRLVSELRASGQRAILASSDASALGPASAGSAQVLIVRGPHREAGSIRRWLGEGRESSVSWDELPLRAGGRP